MVVQKLLCIVHGLSLIHIWITTGEIDIPDKGRQPGEYSLNDERMERATILKALEATGNERKAAARLLGISRSTLYLKLRKYRLD